MDTDTGHNAAQQDIRRLAARLRFRHIEQLSLLQHQGVSLRVAAQALHQTQPALSKSLREVEAAFGFALFVRSARGLASTSRGERALCGATLVAARTGPSAGRGGGRAGLDLVAHWRAAFRGARHAARNLVAPVLPAFPSRGAGATGTGAAAGSGAAGWRARCADQQLSDPVAADAGPAATLRKAV